MHTETLRAGLGGAPCGFGQLTYERASFEGFDDPGHDKERPESCAVEKRLSWRDETSSSANEDGADGPALVKPLEDTAVPEEEVKIGGAPRSALRPTPPLVAEAQLVETAEPRRPSKRLSWCDEASDSTEVALPLAEQFEFVSMSEDEAEEDEWDSSSEDEEESEGDKKQQQQEAEEEVQEEEAGVTAPHWLFHRSPAQDLAPRSDISLWDRLFSAEDEQLRGRTLSSLDSAAPSLLSPLPPQSWVSPRRALVEVGDVALQAMLFVVLGCWWGKGRQSKEGDKRSHIHECFPIRLG